MRLVATMFCRTKLKTEAKVTFEKEIISRYFHAQNSSWNLF